MTGLSSSPVAEQGPSRPGLGPRAAAVLVFGASAAVLVVEIVALRLLAPYLGLTLETSTMVIGIALTAIALGSWLGGRIADQVDPLRLLGPALGISGVVVALTPAVLRSTAEGAPALLILVAALTVLVPGALLSAVTPLVTKVRLTSLAETGTVVGRLSGIGTVGSIVGTVLTGFVLLSRLPVSGILIGLGALLVIASVPVSRRMRGRNGAPAALALALAAGAWRLPSRRATVTSRPGTTAPRSSPTPPGTAATRSSWTACGTPTSTSTTRPTWSSPTSRPSRRWPTPRTPGISRSPPTIWAAAG